MNIFVGNLSFEAAEIDVKKLFERFGNVACAVLVMEKEKKAPKSRGFGFVEMPDDLQARAAIAALNGKEFLGRQLNVNEARPKTEAQAASRVRGHGNPKFKAQALPFSRKPGTYMGGRRTKSYMKRKGLILAQEEAKPWRKSQDNPMRRHNGKNRTFRKKSAGPPAS